MNPRILIALILWSFAFGALGGRLLVLKSPSGLTLRFPLHDQPMRIRFVDPMQAVAHAKKRLVMAPQGTVDAVIPLRQTVEIPLQGRFPVQLGFERRVPLALDIDHVAQVPVTTHADIQASTRAAFGGIKGFRGLGIRAQVPLSFVLRVPIRIRFRGDAWIRYRGPGTLSVDHRLRTHLDERLRVRLVLDQRLTPVLTASVAFGMHPAAEATAIVVTDAQLASRLHLTPR